MNNCPDCSTELVPVDEDGGTGVFHPDGTEQTVRYEGLWCPACKEFVTEDDDGEYPPEARFGDARSLKTEPGFTPPPWKTFMQSGPLIAATPGGQRIYSAGASATDKVDHEANARLIAAAPALYEALMVARQAIKELHDRVFPDGWIIYQTHSPEARQINAALALVAGQTKESE